MQQYIQIDIKTNLIIIDKHLSQLKSLVIQTI